MVNAMVHFPVPKMQECEAFSKFFKIERGRCHAAWEMIGTESLCAATEQPNQQPSSSSPFPPSQLQRNGGQSSQSLINLATGTCSFFFGEMDKRWEWCNARCNTITRRAISAWFTSANSWAFCTRSCCVRSPQKHETMKFKISNQSSVLPYPYRVSFCCGECWRYMFYVS